MKASIENLPALPNNQVDLLISQAIDANVNVETLERLLVMRRELKEEYSREQFYKSLAEFQSQCPIIKKEKAARSDSGLMYKYAPLESIVTQIQDLLKRYGFSYTFDSEVEEGRITAVCHLHHIDGYSISRKFSPRLIRQTRAMNEAQQDSGTFTIAMRRAFCSVLGILTGEEDLDGNSYGGELIKKEQIEELLELLEITGYTMEQLLKGCKVKAIEKMTERQGAAVIINLKGKLEGRLKDE